MAVTTGGRAYELRRKRKEKPNTAGNEFAKQVLQITDIGVLPARDHSLPGAVLHFYLLNRCMMRS